MSVPEKKEEQAADVYREHITLEEAVEIIVSHTTPITRTETVSLSDADGRILAKDMYTEMDNPPFDRSPIDGYACRSADIADATKEHPVFLRVTEEIDAGDYPDRTVQPGEAVRIMTGAPIPAGCDCCVWQEDTDYGEETVAVYDSVPPHGNFCDRGEDFKKGICMLRAGERLDSVGIANLAAMGTASVPVIEIPRIALFTTGDELVEAGQDLAPGKIYNSNLLLLKMRLCELGVPAQWCAHLPDDADTVAQAIQKAVDKGADLVLTTGGVSVGKKDILHDVIDRLGAKKLFWRVRFKPGMPTIFSLYQGVPIVSLSGNPFGALGNLELLLRPMLEKMTGDHTLRIKRVCGILKNDFPKASPGRRFIRARYIDGAVYLPDAPGVPGVEHSSGVLASMRHCNCLVDIAPGSPSLKSGELVSVCLLERSEDLPDQDTAGLSLAGSDASVCGTASGPRIFAISGVKNSGKTTLIESLIPAFADMGWSVAVLKHDAHGFDPDVPGTDTYRQRQAGACGTAIFSDDLSMVVRRESTSERALINAFPDADLILLEGFKWTDYPKIEIVRDGNSESPVSDTATLAGIATDVRGADGFPPDIPVFDLNQPERIAQFIWDYFSRET
ncbi:MAG: molybdopterin-guanine dinucleotide biosynthesis protein B [Lachnospiraceae bacterium]|nr:molybdopterin-guanine dinucleotide biosynthesis protein B [Lachnospiraceae bacterium]